MCISVRIFMVMDGWFLMSENPFDHKMLLRLLMLFCAQTNWQQINKHRSVSYLHKQEAGDDGAAALHSRLLLPSHPSLRPSERPSVQLSVSRILKERGFGSMRNPVRTKQLPLMSFLCLFFHPAQGCICIVYLHMLQPWIFRSAMNCVYPTDYCRSLWKSFSYFGFDASCINGSTKLSKSVNDHGTSQCY